MKRHVLITGIYGFLGSHAALFFQRAGWSVAGIDSGAPPVRLSLPGGSIVCHTAALTLPRLLELGTRFDCIIHCAGTGSVGFSVENPLLDFERNVFTAAQVLEYVRRANQDAKLIIPSSLAVYGEQPDAPIREDAPLSPVSPYGVHKKAVEEMCAYYARLYGLSIGVIRFFSLYGPHLKKQLLWDACRKLEAAQGRPVCFSGTGVETRDWLQVDDAVSLMAAFIDRLRGFSIINGASGIKTVNREVLSILAESFQKDPHRLRFTGNTKPGDPFYCHADISRALALGWHPTISLEAGITEYVSWFREANR